MVHKISITLKSRNICWSLQVTLEVVFTSLELASGWLRLLANEVSLPSTENHLEESLSQYVPPACSGQQS